MLEDSRCGNPIVIAHNAFWHSHIRYISDLLLIISTATAVDFLLQPKLSPLLYQKLHPIVSSNCIRSCRQKAPFGGAVSYAYLFLPPYTPLFLSIFFYRQSCHTLPLTHLSSTGYDEIELTTLPKAESRADIVVFLYPQFSHYSYRVMIGCEREYKTSRGNSVHPTFGGLLAPGHLFLVDHSSINYKPKEPPHG